MAETADLLDSIGGGKIWEGCFVCARPASSSPLYKVGNYGGDAERPVYRHFCKEHVPRGWAPAFPGSEAPPSEKVDHPAHYNRSPSGVECITVVEHCTFNIGSAIKYLWRFEHKNGVEDLRKSIWYINREIERLEKVANGD